MIFALLLVSCAKDERLLPENGPEVAVRFSLQAAPMEGEDPSTRSTDTLTVDDSAIENLWVYQFIGGKFKKKVFVQSNNWNNVEVSLADGGASDLYFAANVDPNNIFTVSMVDSVGMYKLAAFTQSAFLFSGSSKKLIPMRGCIKNYVPNKSVPTTINMYRLLARIDLSYTVDQVWANEIGFKVEDVSVGNVSAFMLIDSVKTDLYPPYSELFPITFGPEAGLSNTSQKISFYVSENRRGFGTNTAKTSTRLKTGVPGATYIKIRGRNSNGELISLTVYPGADAYNDYNVCANTRYHYNLKLTGLSLNDARVKKESPVTSNCYILAPGSTWLIPVSRANMSALGTQIANETTGWTASLYWQTSPGLVAVSTTTASVALGYFKVTAPSTTASGNAVVVVKNAAGDIVWSWHIWVTNYKPVFESENSFMWMTRNLGATADPNGTSTTYATCGGLMYQWGRKDPFPGSDGLTTSISTPVPIYDAAGATMTNASVTWPSKITLYPITGDVVKTAVVGTTSTQIPYASQLSYSVKNPLLFLSLWGGSTATIASDYTTAGGMSSWSGECGEYKSVYDPCPVGWRVPSGRRTSSTFESPWITWTWTQTFTMSTYAALKWYNGLYGQYYYPAAGIRTSGGGVLNFAGVGIYNWSASANASNALNAYFLNVASGTVNLAASNRRSTGMPVRCVFN